MTNTPPNDARNFVHKRILGAATSFIRGGFNPLAAVSGFVAPRSAGPIRAAAPRVQRRPLVPCPEGTRSVMLPGNPKFTNTCEAVTESARGISRAVVRRPSSRTLTARPSATSAAEKSAGRRAKFPETDFGAQFAVPQIFGKCIPPFFDNGQGGCELDLVPGPGGGGTGANRDIGETVMGRYGAGEVPGNQPINRAVCRRGMVLGNDGICYNKSQISNKEREWPRGRRPLLTGGDMRAISTAARAGKRLEGATKRLQKIGLMKKPAPRRSAAQIHHAK